MNASLGQFTQPKQRLKKMIDLFLLLFTLMEKPINKHQCLLIPIFIFIFL